MIGRPSPAPGVDFFEAALVETSALSLSLAGFARSDRDQSSSTAKKPDTFSTICRASSQLRSRPRRGCQNRQVRAIHSSF